MAECKCMIIKLFKLALTCATIHPAMNKLWWACLGIAEAHALCPKRKAGMLPEPVALLNEQLDQLLELLRVVQSVPHHLQLPPWAQHGVP